MPFGWLYGTITSFRNRLYDNGIFKTYHSELKTIVIGNLQVGGSGKTPHTAMLYKWLSKYYKVGILSRGYGRKTSGLIAADDHSTAETIGDEPFWYYRTLHDAKVVVAEQRQLGLAYFEKEGMELVLLDDAFQHRAVSCKLNILLSDFALPYYNDHVMPYGRLREWKTSDKRAHIIIFTKCPAQLKLDEKIEMIQLINPYDYQHVFFTGIKSHKPFALKGDINFEEANNGKIIAMSGIANPESFIAQCELLNRQVVPFNFPDHCSFQVSDINNMLAMLGEKDVVMITEKDASKFLKPDLLELIPEDKVFVLPVEIYFLFNEEERFKETVKACLK
ncbi:MAG: tetraacyldisaccharide 4'-kinase [bacterium]|nr:tetraacyldisaccharide 4'-kinase [bacterium]